MGGRKVTENELKEILRESDPLAKTGDSRDTGLRRAAWEASKQIGLPVRVRTQTGSRACDRLLELVELRNRAARACLCGYARRQALYRFPARTWTGCGGRKPG